MFKYDKFFVRYSVDLNKLSDAVNNQVVKNTKFNKLKTSE